MSHRTRAAVQQTALMAAAQRGGLRKGLVTSYDPKTGAAKVMLQPEGIETGWLPVRTIWGGPGWGVCCPPINGAQVDVEFEVDAENGSVAGTIYNDADQPPPALQGEFWLVHQSGSVLKFTNDGNVTLSANAAMTISAPSGLTIDADTTINGDLSFTGTGSFAGGGPAIARVGDPVADGVITDGSSKVQSG